MLFYCYFYSCLTALTRLGATTEPSPQTIACSLVFSASQTALLTRAIKGPGSPSALLHYSHDIIDIVVFLFFIIRRIWNQKKWLR